MGIKTKNLEAMQTSSILYIGVINNCNHDCVNVVCVSENKEVVLLKLFEEYVRIQLRKKGNPKHKYDEFADFTKSMESNNNGLVYLQYRDCRINFELHKIERF